MTPSIKCATIYDSISIANSIKFRDPMWCPSLLAWLMTYRLLSTQQLCQSMSSNGYSKPNKLTSMKYETQWFSFTKMHIYRSFANCYPFCSGVNVFLLPTLYRNRAICCWSRHNKPIITEPIYLALLVYNTNAYLPLSIWCKAIYHSNIQIYFLTSCLSNSAITLLKLGLH